MLAGILGVAVLLAGANRQMAARLADLEATAEGGRETHPDAPAGPHAPGNPAGALAQDDLRSLPVEPAVRERGGLRVEVTALSVATPEFVLLEDPSLEDLVAGAGSVVIVDADVRNGTGEPVSLAAEGAGLALAGVDATGPPVVRPAVDEIPEGGEAAHRVLLTAPATPQEIAASGSATYRPGRVVGVRTGTVYDLEVRLTWDGG